MELIQSDILTGLDADEKTLILHGCNCHHTMGAGIAKYLRIKFPQIYIADIQQTVKGDVTKLGTYSTAIISPTLHILNCYSQFNWSGRTPVDYAAIESCFKLIAQEYKGWSIRMPKIGCGLAGGDWDIVEQLVAYYFIDFDVTVYYK